MSISTPKGNVLQDQTLSFDGLDIQLAVERLGGGVRVIHLVVADSVRNKKLDRAPLEVICSLLTNKIDATHHHEKYFEINHDMFQNELECVLLSGLVTKTSSVVFLTNGAISVYD